MSRPFHYFLEISPFSSDTRDRLYIYKTNEVQNINFIIIAEAADHSPPPFDAR